MRLAVPRVLVKHRGFSACVILSLGVGISAAAGVFAMVDSVRFAPLPFRNADRVLLPYVQDRAHVDFRRWTMPDDALRALGGAPSPVEAVATVRANLVTVLDADRAVYAEAARVSPNFARVIGVRMALGRAIDTSDVGGPAVTMISYHYWKSDFGGDSTVLGRAIAVNGVRQTIVGVVAEHWAYPDDHTSLWCLADVTPVRDAGDMQVVALLRPGVPIARARAMIATLIGPALRTSHLADAADVIGEVTLRQYLTTDRIQGAIDALSIVAILIGVLAAINFAGLVLARGIRRRGELGVRAALGASTPRLAGEIVAECVVLCALAGLLAAVLAPVAVALLRHRFDAFMPAWFVPRYGWRSVALSVAASTVIGVVFAIGPAVDLARPALQGLLRGVGAAATSSKRLNRTRGVVVAVQVALATGVLVLLGASSSRGLFAPGPRVGYDDRSILTALVTDSALTVDPARWTTPLQLVRETPGVAAAAMTQRSYYHGRDLGAVHADGRAASASSLGDVDVLAARGPMFDIVRPRLIAGRLLSTDEIERGAPAAVVTRLLADSLFEGHAIGRTIRLGDPSGRRRDVPLTIVGAIDDAILLPDHSYEPPTVVAPALALRELPRVGSATLWLRALGPTSPVAREVARRAAAGRFGTPVYDVAPWAATVDDEIAHAGDGRRFMLEIFATALALAAFGIYGLVAYSAEARRRELAIREALGASRARVTGLVLRDAATQAAVGTFIGILIGFVAAAVMRPRPGVLEPGLAATTLAVAGVALTMLVSAVGPLLETWRRDLSAVLRG